MADKIDSSLSVEDTWLITDVARFVARLGEKGILTKQETIKHHTQKASIAVERAEQIRDRPI